MSPGVNKKLEHPISILYWGTIYLKCHLKKIKSLIKKSAISRYLFMIYSWDPWVSAFLEHMFVSIYYTQILNGTGLEFLRLWQEISRLLSLRLLNTLWPANALSLVPGLSEMRSDQQWKDSLGLHWHSVLQTLSVRCSETGPIRQTLRRLIHRWGKGRVPVIETSEQHHS